MSISVHALCKVMRLPLFTEELHAKRRGRIRTCLRASSSVRAPPQQKSVKNIQQLGFANGHPLNY
jgi:hypothetical protein